MMEDFMTSEAGYGSEDELYSVNNNNDTKVRRPQVKNRRLVNSTKNHKQFVTILLVISVTSNIALVTLLMVSKDKSWNTNFDKPCGTPQSPTSTISEMSSKPSTKSSTSGTAGPTEHDSTESKDAQPKQDSNTGIAVKDNANIIPAGASLPNCQTSHPNQKLYDKDSTLVNIFADLTKDEMNSVYEYLKRQWRLRIQKGVAGNHVYSIELHAPSKSAALQYLDKGGPLPPREARVIIVKPESYIVQEMVVGSLPRPTYLKPNPRFKNSSIPFRFHPAYGYLQAFRQLQRFVKQSPELKNLMLESFGASWGGPCGKQCLMMLPQTTSSAYSDTSLVVMNTYYRTEFPIINPLPLNFVMKETKLGHRDFYLHAVQYAHRTYKSIEELLQAYKQPSTPKVEIKFPRNSEGENSTIGSMHLRGKKFPSVAQEGPRQYEPQGKRYSVKNQAVKYLEWSFSYRMSIASGPQVWDVRWAGERIAFEISLQDVGVLYAGANPGSYYAHLSDSAFGLGDKARGLVPGVDCPDHATFLPQTVFDVMGARINELKHAVCIFEHNTGLPLRRHSTGSTYGGLVDRILIYRSIIVEYNYDYIFDVHFHQNGALELKTYATGYLMTQSYAKSEAPFGFQVKEGVVGSIHHHMFNFKIDLDIGGKLNTYKTLDLGLEPGKNWDWLDSPSTEPLQQLSFSNHVRNMEQEALIKYNFSQPKYYVMSNTDKVTKLGLDKSYRIDVKGFAKNILPETSLVVKSRRWSLYEMMVTKHKDEEDRSSSLYSMYDGDDPVIDIAKYWADNEDILQKDLVAWVTVGMQHIPHTEDIPNTPTVGTEATILLTPYNYFEECPSVGSRDQVRIERKRSKLEFKYSGPSLSGNSCLPNVFNYTHFSQDVTNMF